MNAIPEHPTKKETCASKGFPKPKTPGVSKKVRQGVADMIFRKRNRENNNKKGGNFGAPPQPNEAVDHEEKKRSGSLRVRKGER